MFVNYTFILASHFPQNNWLFLTKTYFFSKFVTPGSVVIQATSSKIVSKFEYIAFVRPDNATILITLNRWVITKYQSFFPQMNSMIQEFHFSFLETKICWMLPSTIPILAPFTSSHHRGPYKHLFGGIKRYISVSHKLTY